MSVFRQPKFIVFLLALIAGAFLLQQFWKWEVERVEVPPGKFVVLVHRWGKDLPKEDILAPDHSYKGVQLEVLGPGRHFINPIFWSYEIHDMIDVPRGECLVLIRKFGKEIPPERIASGDILAKGRWDEHAGVERGVVEQPLLPGLYAINPYAFDTRKEKAVEITAEFVGVRTRKVGKDPRTLPEEKRTSPYVVSEEGYRGVEARYVPPGTYYVNSYVETITPIEVRSHKVEFSDIQFPSRDGFMLNPHVQVEYAVMKDKAPEVLVRVTDEGELNQADSTEKEKENNEILQKIVLPHIRGFARIEGSNFNAADFISVGTDKEKENNKATNSRERFQKAILEAVKPRCAKHGIDIRAITLAEMELPKELKEEISARDSALAEQQRNMELVKQHKQEQALKAQEKMADQKTEKVRAETRLRQAETEAEQLIEVEKQKLTAALKVAESQLQAAKEKAKSLRAQAKAEADVTMAQNEAEVAALKKSVEGFGGAQNFAQYTMMSKVAPALGEIFASESSDFGKLFSSLMLEREKERDGSGPRMPAAADVPTNGR